MEAKTGGTTIEVFNDTLGVSIPVEVKFGVYGWCNEEGSGEVKIGSWNASHVLESNGQLVFIRPFKNGENAGQNPLDHWYKNMHKIAANW